MPDGSPCDMLPATPAPLSVKHFAQEAAASDGPAHVVAMPALPAFAIAAVPVSPQEALRFDAVPPAQGPPPLLLTLRLRH